MVSTTVVGGLRGEASVGSDGTLSWGLPLELPPGVAGLQPELHLTYNSGGGSGLLGMGFGLSGLASSIARCPRNVEEDGESAPVNFGRFGQSDTLCLDGQKLLLTNGQHMAAGARYRTRRESWRRVEIVGNVLGQDGRFVVRDRNGLEHHYGPDPNARAMRENMPYVWLRTLTRDRFGNEIQYSYDARWDEDDPTTTAEIDLVGVGYAYGPSGIHHQVTIHLEDRPDVRRSWFYGAPQLQSRRVRQIVTATVPGDTLREYDFRYAASQGTGTSLLRSVTACAYEDDGTRVCLPATTFSWSEVIPPLEQNDPEDGSLALFGTGASADGYLVTVVADLDGDQKHEYLHSLHSEPGRPWRIWRIGEAEAHELQAPGGGLVPSDAVTPQVKGGEGLQLNGTSIGLAPLAVDLDRDGRDEVLVPTTDCRDNYHIFACGEVMSWLVPLPDGNLVHGYATGLGILDADPTNPGGLAVRSLEIQATLPPRIYQVVPPYDGDGDGRVDIAFCGGESLADATWRFLHHDAGDVAGPFSFVAYDLGISCTEYPSVAGPIDWDADGAAELLLGRSELPAYFEALDGGHPQPYEFVSSGLYQVVEIPHVALAEGTFQAQIDAAGTYPWLVNSGLPVDLTARTFSTSHCGVAGADALQAQLRARFGEGTLRYGDFNGDSITDILRFDVWNGATGGFPQPGSGELLAVEPESCEPLDATNVIALRVWYGTGDGWVPGNALLDWTGEVGEPGDEADAGAHLLGLLRRGSVADLNDDGTDDLIVPQTVAGFGWDAVLTTRDFGIHEVETDLVWPNLFRIRGRPGIATDAGQVGLLFTKATNMSGVDSPGHWRTYTRPPFARDLLVATVDGMGRGTRFEYKPATDRVVHAPVPLPALEQCAPHQTCGLGRRFLVSRVREDAGMADPEVTLDSSYRYLHGRMGQGAGVGFEEIIRTDRVSTVALPIAVTREVFNAFYDETYRVFPFWGEPSVVLSERAYADAQSATGYTLAISRTTSLAEVRAAPGTSGFFVVPTIGAQESFLFPSSACASLYTGCLQVEISDAERDYPAIDSSTHSSTFDGWGNLTSTRGETREGSVSYVQHEDFAQDEETWSLGMPQSTTTMAVQPSGAFQTRKTNRTFDVARMALNTEIREPGSPNLELSRQLSYDTFGNVRKITTWNSLGETRITNRGWESTRGLTLQSTTNALGHVRQIDMDPATGLVRSHRDPNGVVRTYTYDAFGRNRTETTQLNGAGPSDGLDVEQQLAWDASAGSSVYRIDRSRQDGVRGRSYYDRLGREVRQCWPHLTPRETPNAGFDVCQDFDRDARGQIGRVSVPYPAGSSPTAWHHTNYDNLGRPFLDTSPEGRTVRYTHGARSITAIDAHDRAHTVVANDRGETQMVIEADGTMTCYAYWPFGALRRVDKNCAPDAGGPQVDPIEVTANAYGQVLAIQDPDLGPRGFAYKAGFGEVTLETDAMGAATSYVHDLLGRVVAEQRPGATVTYTWDTAKIGALTQVSGPDLVHRNFLYDPFLRPTAEQTIVEGELYQVTMSYAQGHLESLEYPNGFRVDFQYDGNGDLRALRRGDTGDELWSADEQALVGALSRVRFGVRGTTTRTFDQDGFLTSEATSHLIAGLVRQWSYAWDEDGSLVERREDTTEQRETFEYDDLGRLTDIRTYRVESGGEVLRQHVVQAYDVFGNLTHRTGVGAYVYAYGASGNRPSSVGGVDYVWDANGRLESRSGFAASETFDWTSFDRLRRVSTGSGGVVNLIYGADGNRVRETDEAGAVTTFIGGLYEERRKGGEVSRRCLVSADEPVAALTWSESDGVTTETLEYLHADHLGSVTSSTLASGNLARDVFYTPWGEVRAGTDWVAQGSPASLPDFTGHDGRIGLDLVNMKARFYDARIGRFLQPDDLVPNPTDPQSMNRYAYVLNDPLGTTDPSGHRSDRQSRSRSIHPTQQGYTPMRGAAGDYSWIKLDADGNQVRYIGVGAAFVDAKPVHEARSAGPTRAWDWESAMSFFRSEYDRAARIQAGQARREYDAASAQAAAQASEEARRKLGSLRGARAIVQAFGDLTAGAIETVDPTGHALDTIGADDVDRDSAAWRVGRVAPFLLSAAPYGLAMGKSAAKGGNDVIRGLVARVKGKGPDPSTLTKTKALDASPMPAAAPKPAAPADDLATKSGVAPPQLTAADRARADRLLNPVTMLDRLEASRLVDIRGTKFRDLSPHHQRAYIVDQTAAMRELGYSDAVIRDFIEVLTTR